MDTGRTEHFTDEGMLGAVHAFLDEVFDGRDMLLRSTLNVLHERELKQGTDTRGRIECALMTTTVTSRRSSRARARRCSRSSIASRSSPSCREGFADPANLARVAAPRSAGAGGPRSTPRSPSGPRRAPGRGRPGLRLGRDLRRARAPSSCSTPSSRSPRAPIRHFLPTRYLSTRTAVRSAACLRAIASTTGHFNAPPARSRSARADLLAPLFTSLSAGADRTRSRSMLARETDPRERRQLAILRTEREIFDSLFPQAAAGPTDAAEARRADAERRGPSASRPTDEPHESRSEGGGSSRRARALADRREKRARRSGSRGRAPLLRHEQPPPSARWAREPRL